MELRLSGYFFGCLWFKGLIFSGNYWVGSRSPCFWLGNLTSYIFQISPWLSLMLTLSAIFILLFVLRDLTFFGPYYSSLLSPLMNFRIPLPLLAIGFSLEESSLTINAGCFPWFIVSCVSCSVSELTVAHIAFHLFGSSSSEDDELLLLILLVD